MVSFSVKLTANIHIIFIKERFFVGKYALCEKKKQFTTSYLDYFS